MRNPPWRMRGHPLERRMMSDEKHRNGRAFKRGRFCAKAYRVVKEIRSKPLPLTFTSGLSMRRLVVKSAVQSRFSPVFKTKNSSAKPFRFAERRRGQSPRCLGAENAEWEERLQYPKNILFPGAPVQFSRLRPFFQRTSAANPPYRGEPDAEPHPLRRCFPSAGAVPARH